MGKRDKKVEEKGGSSKDNDGEAEDDDKSRGRLDDKTIDYFKRVHDVVSENNFQSEDDQRLFFRNVFTQVMGENFIQLCRHNYTSEVVKLLAKQSSIQHLSDLTCAIVDSDTALFTDRYGSHVIEGVIDSILPYANQLTTSESLIGLWKAFKRLCKVLLDNVGEFIRDVYACHVLSSLIQLLGGRRVAETITRSRMSRNRKSKLNNNVATNSGKEAADFDAPAGFTKLLRKQCSAILQDDNFGTLLCNPCSSPVIQTLLIVLEKRKKTMFRNVCEKTVSKMRLDQKGQNSEKVPVMLADPIGSHVVEVLLRVAPLATFNMIYENIFKGNLLLLCMHPIANFTVQSLTSHMTDPQLVQSLFDEADDLFEDILASGHMGIAVQLAKCAANHPTVQTGFRKALLSALHVTKTNAAKYLAKLILTLTTFDTLFTDEEDEDDSSKQQLLSKDNLTYHGSCILTELIKFKKPASVVESILNLTPAEIVVMACHEHASFALESLIKCQTLKVQQRQKMTEMLEPNLLALVCDKFGSHVIDTVFRMATAQQKQHLTGKLLKFEKGIKRDFYGKHVLRNLGLEDGEQSVKRKRQDEASDSFVSELLSDTKTRKKSKR